MKNYDSLFLNPQTLDSTPIEWAKIDQGLKRARRLRSKAQSNMLKAIFMTLIGKPAGKLAQALHLPGSPAHG